MKRAESHYSRTELAPPTAPSPATKAFSLVAGKFADGWHVHLIVEAADGTDMLRRGKRVIPANFEQIRAACAVFGLEL